ncbi:MAG: ribose 5-phosphate isomerase B [Thermoplasmatota archaeon]
MKISIGSDHGGFQLKEFLKERLTGEGHEITDRGCPDPSSVDYPDIAFDVSKDVAGGFHQLGILICGTGIGMSNAASRVDGIVAALCTNAYMAEMARKHNDANILCLGGRVVGDELAWSIVLAFLDNEPLRNEKYIRRRKKVADGSTFRED